MFRIRITSILFLGVSLVLGSPAAPPRHLPSANQEISKEIRDLIERLKSPPMDAQREAALKLRDMGGRAAVAIPELIKILGMGTLSWDGLDDKGKMTGGSINFADSAAMILAAIGRPAVEPLLQVLKDGAKPGVRENQIEREASAALRAEAIRVLGTIKDERAVEPLVQALKDSTYAVSVAAARALLAFGNPILLDGLEAALNSPNPDYRDIVAWMFIQKKDPRVFSYIRRKLQSPYPDIREAGLSDLEAFGDARAIPFVTGLLDKDPDADVRAKAARILGDLGNPAAVEALIRALQAAQTEVCANAAQALGKLKDPKAVEPLTRLLKDPRPEVRDAAAAALKSVNAKAPLRPPAPLLLLSRSTT